MSGKHKTKAMLIAWGILTLGAFWQMEWQYLRPVARPVGAIVAHPENLPTSPFAVLETERGALALNREGPVTWINFWNPDCPCSRYAEAQVQRLAKRHEPRGVRMVTVIEYGDAPGAREAALAAWHKRGLSAFLVAADPQGRIARAFGVWAAPAAVILDKRGRMAYVGAYNAARYCDNGETAWAAQALEAITQEHRPLHPKTPFYGCQVLASRGR